MKLVLATGILLLLAVASAAQCPSIKVMGPASVTLPGDAMTFWAEIGVAGPKLTYRWTVSAGTIEEGQGTTRIFVRTDKSNANSNITATVEIEGLPTSCQKTGFETAPVVSFGCGAPMDEWEDLKPNDVRTRLDNFFADLSNNPDHTGLMILTVTEKEKLNVENKRLQLAVQHARFRKFDLSRIWFSLEVGERPRTKIYRFPLGAELPCDNCTMIKGGDL